MNFQLTTNTDNWLFSLETLEKLRTRSNFEALHSIIQLNKKETQDKNEKNVLSVGPSRSPVKSVQCFATRFSLGNRKRTQKLDYNLFHERNSTDLDISTFLSVKEENLLIQFYTSKLFSLIGPNAQIPRLRKDSKVAYTAALLLKRFYLSNSVMIYDPKKLMVGAAFLASKVEDSTVDIRNLEDGTRMMHSVVLISDIIRAEISLISGINFQLLCYHPYNVVLAIAEDLRTFLKSDHGRKFCSFQDGIKCNRKIVGEDLRSMYDLARKFVDDAAVSDIPLLASPGQIGLASIMLANQELLSLQSKISNECEELKHKTEVPIIYFHGYIRSRFTGDGNQENVTRIINMLEKVCCMLKKLKKREYGCVNYKMNLENLKVIHKKLKKCWMLSGDVSTKNKKKRKRN